MYLLFVLMKFAARKRRIIILLGFNAALAGSSKHFKLFGLFAMPEFRKE